MHFVPGYGVYSKREKLCEEMGEFIERIRSYMYPIDTFCGVHNIFTYSNSTEKLPRDRRQVDRP